MNGNHSFQRFVATTAIASFFFGMASNVVQGIPVHFNPDAIAHPELFLAVGREGAALLRAGLILDMFGYYLLILPLVLWVRDRWQPESPQWVRFYTLCGLGFIWLGALGAISLAVVQPALSGAYEGVAADQRAVLEAIFVTLWTIVYRGMWNILGGLLIGIWFLGTGSIVRRERRLLGLTGMLTGLAVLLDALASILGLDGIAFLGLAVYLLLAPTFALWMGIDLLRRRLPPRVAHYEEGMA